jgi:large subunit ribosomal protein L22
MHNYSYTGSKEGVVFALMDNIDASYKDLGAVCDAIRYRKADHALAELEEISSGRIPVYYRRNNTGFGDRHELGGRKGRYPMKAAKIVRRVLVNAIANARNKGYEPEDMVVVLAAANKTQILVRSPPKGVMFLGSGITGHTYGFSPARRSNLEYAKVEIALASELEAKLSEKAKKLLKKYEKAGKKLETKAASTKSKSQIQKTQKAKVAAPAAEAAPKPLPQKAQEAKDPKAKDSANNKKENKENGKRENAENTAEHMQSD